MRISPPLRRLLALAAVLAALPGAAACGDDAGTGDGTGGTTAADGAGVVAFERRMVQVVAEVAPSVVQIETGRGLGSGVAYDDEGHVVTNAHVVGDAQRVRVTAADGESATATVVGTFAPGDLAVVRANGLDVEPARFGGIDALRVGEIVLAIGNPLGLSSSVTHGIVSALGRDVQGPEATLPNTIQTSAPINPGNSGGALVDLDRLVVGIPTIAATDPRFGGAANGIGFAIPSDVVRELASQIIEQGRVVESGRAYLGVRLASAVEADGALVGAVVDGSPADEAGIRAGDAIVAIDGEPVAGAPAATAIIVDLDPGDTVDVRLRRDGDERTVEVELGDYAGRAP